MKQTETIGGRKCTIYTAAGAEVLLLQAVDDHDQCLLDSEVATARSLTDVPFNLVAFGIKEWMRELTPWPAPPTFGKQPVGDGAEETLGYVRDLLLPLSAQRWGALPAVMGGGYINKGLIFALALSLLTPFLLKWKKSRNAAKAKVGQDA